MAKTKDGGSGYGFGTFQGVFTPSILTIIGVVMYLRFGWMLGHLGLAQSLVIVTIGSSITFLTGLSISALATNMRMKGGGAYFMLSRSLGPEAGAALGIPLALSQSVAVSFYVSGFTEALVNSGLPVVSGWDPRIAGLATLAVIALVSSISADLALKTQYFIMAAIGASLFSFFLGGSPAVGTPPAGDIPPALDFWAVFAVFFPAVTGILSGLGMSGDLKDPAKSIPRGTIAAVLAGYVVYMSVPVALNAFVSDPAVLRTDMMIFQKCARWAAPVLLGVWAATLSSAMGSFLVAPRVVQALSRDRLLPHFLSRGYGRRDDPLPATAFCFAVAAFGIFAGKIDILAPILTLFNLSTYALLNFSAGFEELMSNPSWRPTFRTRSFVSLAGFALCVSSMFMISPGWTIIAIAVEAAIYFLSRRRRLSARWGDMRSGLLDSLARYALRSLARYEGTRSAERNWRPNMLILARLPVQNASKLVLAREISGGRSFVTLASVLPEELSSHDRERFLSLESSMARTARRHSLDATPKLVFAQDAWNGISELVRTYGFGPLVPNTIIFGIPSKEDSARLAGAISAAASRRRNVVISGGHTSALEDGFIDIWWRGANSNAGLMLALAYLIQRSGAPESRPLRLNMIVRNRTREEAERTMSEFLSGARVKALTRVIEEKTDRGFMETISDHSADAAMTFVGMKAPPDGTVPSDTDAYGNYLSALYSGISAKFPVFVLAAEQMDFSRIFS